MGVVVGVAFITPRYPKFLDPALYILVTTCIIDTLGPVLNMAIPWLYHIYISIKRPSPFKDDFFLARTWSLEAGFTGDYQGWRLCAFAIMVLVLMTCIHISYENNLFHGKKTTPAVVQSQSLIMSLNSEMGYDLI
jgi:hypothetical protein